MALPLAVCRLPRQVCFIRTCTIVPCLFERQKCQRKLRQPKRLVCRVRSLRRFDSGQGRTQTYAVCACRKALPMPLESAATITWATPWVSVQASLRVSVQATTTSQQRPLQQQQHKAPSSAASSQDFLRRDSGGEARRQCGDLPRWWCSDCSASPVALVIKMNTVCF